MQRGNRATLEEIAEQWRKRQSRDLGTCSGVDFSGSDLSGLTLENLSFDNCIFDRVNWQKATLYWCELYNISAVGADFSGAILDDCYVSDADLQGARFVGADLEGCRLYASDLTGSDFSNARLHGTSFMGSTLTDTNIAPPFSVLGSRLGTLAGLGWHTDTPHVGLNVVSVHFDPRVVYQSHGYKVQSYPNDTIARMFAYLRDREKVVRIPEDATICIPYGSRGEVWTDRVVVLDDFSLFCLDVSTKETNQ